MVLVNDDQCIIADIVLAQWFKVKKLNHPSIDTRQGLNRNDFVSCQKSNN